MSDFQFTEPVVLRAGGHLLEVRDALQASRALTESWPETRGKWYYAANRACRSAVKGETSAILARRMFKEAVDESRLGA
ncbi:DUF982 domain-containing protein [Aliihoeflea aestuarii]|jgi:hypothetical protein|uniref:DUF982 domain-containing protein n=1 Tax=Aliihoeflea aestuarii TaxID=453840 RepID=UPI00209283DC|nr:DUF982 domain-containing protein [Aliihoeflea aestuarii]MCO6391174.1 DUF982 domain-containing protein [Aliihoeflea aestuarii]